MKQSWGALKPKSKKKKKGNNWSVLLSHKAKYIREFLLHLLGKLRRASFRPFIHPSIGQQLPWVSCERNSSYSFVLIFLKLCRCLLHGIGMCMWFAYVRLFFATFSTMNFVIFLYSWYTVFSMSVDSITSIAFVWFCSNLQHIITIRQCMFDRKIGAEGSVLQELCHFVILTTRCLIMTDSDSVNILVFFSL